MGERGKTGHSKSLSRELQEIFYRRKFEVTNRKVIMYQGCLTYGWVSRGGDEDTICSNPECVSCRQWEKVLKEMVSEFLTDDKDFIDE